VYRLAVKNWHKWNFIKAQLEQFLQEKSYIVPVTAKHFNNIQPSIFGYPEGHNEGAQRPQRWSSHLLLA
jgi:hypothetical protein